MSYVSFIQHVENGSVEEVVFLDSNKQLSVKIKDHTQLYQVPNPMKPDFTEFLLLNNISIMYESGSMLTTVVQVIISVLFFAGIAWYAIRLMNENKQKVVDANKSKIDKSSRIKFDNVAGNIEAKAMVKDIVDFIKMPDKYAELGARMPKGILFYGPPGTGKTLMAKAIAGEANAPFYPVSGSDFIQMYVGVGASRIRKLFKKAKQSEKAVIFIDEIDAIGKKRAARASASNDERDQTLNALLTEMSGFNDNEGIVVIAATNRLDMLDDALLRPGRFDRQIEIGLPDYNARKAILGIHAKNKPLDEEVSLDKLATDTVFFSGAMLENLMNEAAITAANDACKVINKTHIDIAFYTVVAGAQKQDRSVISDKDKKITAYHEAGHALITKLLLPENTITKVTIIPSVRGAGGFSMSVPKDKLYYTKKELKSNIQILFAGRVAEVLTFGKEDMTTGASNDIEKASKLIKDYVVKYGMDDDYGLFNLEAIDIYHNDAIINKCREQMKIFYDETVKIMNENSHLLIRIAEQLLQKETLDGMEIDKLCA